MYLCIQMDTTKLGKNFCQRRLVKHHIDNGERQMAIRNKATRLLHLRLTDLSLAMMVGAMVLVLSRQGTMNKSYT